MMKRFLMILVMVSWCSVGVAENYETKLKKKEGKNYSVYNEYVEKLHDFWRKYNNDETCSNIDFRGPTNLLDHANCNYDTVKKHFKRTVGRESQRILDVNHDHYQGLFNLAKKITRYREAGYRYDETSHRSEFFAIERSWLSDLDYEVHQFAMAKNDEYLAWKKKKEKEEGPKIDDNEILAASSGTGFFVSRQGHIVTNYHVTENCNPVKVIFKDTEVEAKILAVDKRNDLAIIKANINPDKAYALSNKDVSLMQDVIVAGFPLGKEISSAIKTHKGSVTALAGFGDNYSNFETDATINPGNSGGPIVDHKGNIVGVAVATWVEEGVQGIHFGIKSSTLKTFANANEITFLPASNREMSKEKLTRLVTDATVFLECWMTGAKIKQLMAQKSNRKAFYSKFK